MEIKHTPEPWIIPSGKCSITSAANDDVRKYWCITTRDTGRHYDDEISNANARRIVACVNACAGIATDTLEGEFKSLGAEYTELVKLLEFSDKRVESIIKHRDELLEALEKAKQFIENGIEFGYIRMPDADTPDSAHNVLPIISEAINKAKG